jgi:hypothetical protein F3_00972
MQIKETSSIATFDETLGKLGFEEPKMSLYERVLKTDAQNPNVYSTWAKAISNEALSYCGVERPIFQTITLPEDIFMSLIEDRELDKERELEINDYFASQCKLKFPIFVKNSLFSNKFDFYNCIIYDKCQFARYLKNIFYASMCMDCDFTAEVVFEELIPVAQCMRIYNSMPVNTEYRAFIDFDNKKVIGILDYWHESIAHRLPREQVEVFKMYKNRMKLEYEHYLPILEEKLQAILDNNAIEVKGVWSVDFLLDYYNEFWLIDMAIASKSWGFSLLEKKNREE